MCVFCLCHFILSLAVAVTMCLIRGLLADIVQIKMEHYDMSKVRSQSAEEYLKAFFEMELKPVWPQGWIQTRFDMHSHYIVWNKRWQYCTFYANIAHFVLRYLVSDHTFP